MNARTQRLNGESSILVLIDMQDKLLAKQPAADQLIRNAGFLLDVAAALHVSILATEQYPQGLGATQAELRRRLAETPLAKTAFSCWGAAPFLDAIKRSGKTNIVLMGMETHVCIAQTALDLLTEGHQVYLPVDTLGSRFLIDHDIALRRLESAGAVLTTAEAVAFEWLGDAAHPQFKAVSRLVIERSKMMT